MYPICIQQRKLIWFTLVGKPPLSSKVGFVSGPLFFVFNDWRHMILCVFAS